MDSASGCRDPVRGQAPQITADLISASPAGPRVPAAGAGGVRSVLGDNNEIEANCARAGHSVRSIGSTVAAVGRYRVGVRRVLSVNGIPGRGHSLLQDARVGGVLRGLARVSGIGGECFSWMGRGSSAVTRLLLI